MVVRPAALPGTLRTTWCQRGRFEIFKMPAAGGEAVQVTRDGGWAAQESPDGKYLFYCRDRGYNIPLLKVPVDGGAETKVLDSVGERQWRVVKEGVWFIAGSRLEPSVLRFLSFATGKISEVGFTPNPTRNGVDVTPDGRTILYTQLDHTGTELMLVENFR
jgi:Tol biopolymer transport system component